MKIVYLADPIADCSYGEATAWRNVVSYDLKQVGVRTVSPMRAKEFLKGEGRITGAYPEHLSSGVHGIGARDEYDVTHCDMVLAYLPREMNERRPSVGTMMELGVAHHARVPLVLVTDDEHLVQHPLVQAWTGWIVPDFESALEVIQFVLGPYLKKEYAT